MTPFKLGDGVWLIDRKLNVLAEGDIVGEWRDLFGPTQYRLRYLDKVGGINERWCYQEEIQLVQTS